MNLMITLIYSTLQNNAKKSNKLKEYFQNLVQENRLDHDDFVKISKPKTMTDIVKPVIDDVKLNLTRITDELETKYDKVWQNQIMIYIILKMVIYFIFKYIKIK